MESWSRDLRHAVGRLAATPAFSISVSVETPAQHPS